MGSVEVDDQVAGLEAAAKIAPYIDLKRVGICGWSYGMTLQFTIIIDWLTIMLKNSTV